MELQSLIEQCCNFYLKQGCFPAFYEELQPIPVLKVGILPYAADDGGDKGQAYHLRLDPQKRVAFFAFRFPDAGGRWSRKWAEPEMVLTLPDQVVERLRRGAPLAPLLREIGEPDGTRYAVLDFIVEVPLSELPERAQIQRVLGWDWGVRTLVPATVVDLSGNRLAQVCHPSFCFVPRNDAPLVWIAALHCRLTNQDLLLSNGTVHAACIRFL